MNVRMVLWRFATPAVLLGARAAAQMPTDTAAAVAEVRAAEMARLRGDSAAWRLLAPGFLFAHSTGAVNDRAAFLAFRSRGLASGARVPEPRDAEPAVVRLDGDVLVTSRLVADSAPAGARAHASRLLDVYVRRGGAWQWLAHQTSEVAPRWVPASLAPAALDELAGAYTAADGARRVFARRGDALVYAGPGGERALVPLSDATFGYPAVVATVTFVRDRVGRVVAADESAQVGFRRYVRTSP